MPAGTTTRRNSPPGAPRPIAALPRPSTAPPLAGGREGVTAAIFWLKARARWKETSVHELAAAEGSGRREKLKIVFVEPDMTQVSALGRDREGRISELLRPAHRIYQPPSGIGGYDEACVVPFATCRDNAADKAKTVDLRHGREDGRHPVP